MPRSRSAMIIERAPLPIVEVQGSAHIVSHVNSAFCRLVGKSREDLIGKSFADIVHGGDQCMPILDRVYQTGEAATHAQEDDSDSASTSWLYAMWPALDENEQPVGVIIQLAKTANLRQDAAAVNEALLIAVLRQHALTEAAEKLNAQLQAEIIERKASEEALRASEVRFRVAALAVSNLIWTNNAQGMMEGEQPGWAQFTGQALEEYQGYGWARAVHPDDAQPTIDAWNAAVAEKRLFEFEHRVRRHDGVWRSCSVRAVPVIGGDGEIREWVGVHNDITERKHAEAVLRESHERTANIVESIADAFVTLDKEWRFTFLNDRAMEIMEPLKKSREELLGKNLWEQFPELVGTVVEENYRRAMDGQMPTEFELYFPPLDAWFYLRASPSRDGISIYYQDVTARKRAGEALRQSEARKSAILDGALDGIITMNHEGKVVDFNPAAEAMFGITRAEILGELMAERIIPARLREAHYRGLAHYLTSGEGPVLKKRIEVPALHADGHEFTIELSINRIPAIEPPMFTATLRDITERQRLEAAMRESEERFHALAENMAQLAWMADAEGFIFWYNQRWFDYTGTTLDRMQGWGWKEVHHPEHLPRVEARWKAHLAAGTGFEDTFPLLGADGQYGWFLTRAVPIRDASGKVQRWFGTNTDVTAQREAADALATAKEQVEAASRAKDDFLAALSHELRTPLTPVLMTAASLETDPSLSEAVRDQLSMMRRNIELEARLIDDLLDLTRISRGKLSIAPVASDIHQLLEHTAEIIRSDGLGKQVRVVFVLDAGQHHALADPVRLQQVFWNLIKNALKFTPGGGTITVRTRNDAKGWIVVSVEDNGVGIAAEALPHIFKAFEQGDVAGQHRYGGLGLGLAISQAIVAVHGGIIRAESPGVGHGATFTVALATVAPPSAPSGGETSPAEPVRALRLLIVEDHEATRTVLTRLLTRSGHHVTAASTMRDALVCFAAERFDAVVSDLGLPDGSGLDLMRELQRRRPIPGIALSGYGMEDDLRQTKEAGFFAHLVKPVNIGQLRNLLAQVPAPRA